MHSFNTTIHGNDAVKPVTCISASGLLRCVLCAVNTQSACSIHFIIACLWQRRGKNLTIFMELFVCAREEVELGLYLWFCMCLCQRRGGTRAIFMVLHVFVPEKRWNSGYVHGSACVCARDEVEFWLYSWNSRSVVVPEKGGTWATFMAQCLCQRISVEVFMPYWNLEQTKDINQNHGKGGWWAKAWACIRPNCN